ncbi:MAG: hypothetical protein ACK5JE_02790 [Castellaniella sp.]|uniref:hypothetical protein n=1 Tax=Castellaniella sp. TaxID=1955812 RepID=UPI003A8B809D
MSRLSCLSLLVLLTACAQQPRKIDAPSPDVPVESTVSDARHRAQGDTRAIAPTQLQFGFGADNQSEPASTRRAPDGAKEASTPADTGNMPQELTETRTYLGTIACPAGQQNCAPRRMTLTLAPDEQWRARSAPLSGKAVTASMGCWHLVSTAPARIVLQTGDKTHATLEFIQSNVLRLTWLDGQVPLLESRLTRQADIDPIQEMAAKPAQACTAR